VVPLCSSVTLGYLAIAHRRIPAEPVTSVRMDESVLIRGDDPPDPPDAIRSGRQAGRRGWHGLRRC